MTSINLLPWREALRRERKKRFLSTLGLSAALMGLIVVFVHMQYGRLIAHQESRNDLLKTEISRVEKQIKEIEALEKKKKRLLARMNVIQRLQQDRPLVVHLFEELVGALPNGVYLTNLKQQDGAILVDGYAQSNARVSAFMRNLDASSWLHDPKLSVIEAAGRGQEGNASKFTLNVRIVDNVAEGMNGAN